MFSNLKLGVPGVQAPGAASLELALAGSGTTVTIHGGDGNDVLVLQGGLAGSTRIDGGTGSDIVDYSQLLASSGTTGAIFADLATQTVRKYENGRLVGTDTLAGIEGIIGSRYDDTLGGSDKADTLDGAGGNDLITGAAGNDSLDGGDGDDCIRQSDWRADTTVDGGNGIDTLDYSGLIDFSWGISVNLASGYALKGNTGIPAGLDSIRNIEVVVGTFSNDTLVGNTLANRLDGGDGADTLLGDRGNDTLNGGAGDDYIEQNWEFDGDVIDGGSGNDTVNYNSLGTRIDADLQAGIVYKKYMGEKLAGTDTIRNVEHLIGTDYNDTLRGSANADILGGNEGDDLLYGAAGNDTLKGYYGNDTLYGGANDDHLDGGAGDDHLIGGEGRNEIHGGDGDDTIEQVFLHSLDTIDGNIGTDVLDYSAIRYDGVDTLYSGLDIDMMAGTTYLATLLTSFLKDRFRNIEGVIGSDRHDRINGNDAANLLAGGDGHDVLDGGGGNDTLSGDAGNDSVFGADGDDLIMQAAFRGNDTLDGGDGRDTLDYRDADESNARIVIDLAAGTGLKFVNGAKVGKDVIRNVESVIGTINDDRIVGSANTEWLDAGAGKDTLASGGGNDTLLGGDGDDSIAGAWKGNASLAGGDGYDVLDYSGLPANSGSDNSTLIIDLTTSTVFKYDAGKYAGTDMISGFESLVASRFDDEITGDGGDNRIDGAGGHDIINGGGGNDLILGGDGDDLISQSDAAGNAVLNGGNGNDLLFYTGLDASVVVDLAIGQVIKFRGEVTLGVDRVANFERVVGSFQADMLKGSSGSDDMSGSLGNDSILGGAGDDHLSGDEQDDAIGGEDGDDYLDGGDGADSLLGGAGNDRLFGGSGNDDLRGGDGKDYLDGGAGDDLLDGGADNDLLYGRAGDDVLTGGAGNNLLEGGDGDDIFMAKSMSSSDTMVGGAGIDAVGYDIQLAGGPTATINANLATGKVLKYQNGALLATDILSGIEELNGSVNNDTLMGSKYADTIHGNSGNDTINGGAGNDLLVGEGGDDRFNQFDLNSQDTFSGGSGIDTLDYSGLQGPAGVNVSVSILLKDGNVPGGAVKIQNGNAAGGMMDTVRDIEFLIGSKGNDQLSGNAANNRFEGGAGNDTLDGGGGNDTLLGGAGDDQFIQSLTYDSDTFDGGSDLDQVNYSFDESGASIIADLATGRVVKFKDGYERGTDTLVSIELFHGSSGNDSISGSAKADYLNGLDGKDTIRGLGGDDYLYGGAGDDVLNGGSGNDFLSGDGGNDLYVFDRGFGKDEIENPNRGSFNVDIVQFNEVTATQVLFQRVGNNLSVSIAGTQDQVTIDNWYALIEGTRGEGNINQFKAGGLTLDGNVVIDYVKIMGAPPVSMAVMLGAA